MKTITKTINTTLLAILAVALIGSVLLSGCNKPPQTNKTTTKTTSKTKPVVPPATTTTIPAVATTPKPAANLFTLRINCGADKAYQDPRGNKWEADREYEKGKWGALGGEVVDRGDDVKIEGTDMALIYRTERYNTEGYRVTCPNGKYQVSLHFAETYDPNDAPGMRVFAISIQGKEVVPALDVVKEAGKQFKALVKSFAADVTGGELTITLKPNISNTEINGVEVIQVTSGDTAPPVVTVTPPPQTLSAGGFALRINCGADKAYQDPRGNKWEADREYEKGKWGALGGEVVDRGDDVKIEGTDMAPIYRTERYNSEGYRVTCPNGKYQVSLHFAETYDPNDAPGMRVFAISIQGKEVVPSLDVVKETGKQFKALVKSFAAEVTNGELTITLKPNISNTEINGVEVIQVASAEATPPVVTVTPPATPVVASGNGAETEYLYTGDYQTTEIHKISTADGSYECFIKGGQGKSGTGGGCEFDSHGNLFSIHGGTVVKITPDKMVTVILTGLGNGFDMTVDSNDNLILGEYTYASTAKGPVAVGKLFKVEAKNLVPEKLPIKIEYEKDAAGKPNFEKCAFTPEGSVTELDCGFPPYGLSYDRNGNVYVQRLCGPFFKYDASGKKTQMCEKSLTYWQRLGIMDAHGDFYVFGQDIVKVSADGRAIARMAPGYGFVHAVGLAIDSKGNIWQTDPHKKEDGGGKLYKYTPDGQRSLVRDHLGVSPFWIAIWPRAKFPAVRAQADRTAAISPATASTTTKADESDYSPTLYNEDEAKEQRSIMRLYLEPSHIPSPEYLASYKGGGYPYKGGEIPEQLKAFSAKYQAVYDKIVAALPEKLAIPVTQKRKILVLCYRTGLWYHAPGAAGYLILLREAAKKYGAFELTEVYKPDGIDAKMLAGFDVVVLDSIHPWRQGEFGPQFGLAAKHPELQAETNKRRNEELAVANSLYNELLPAYVKNGGSLITIHATLLTPGMMTGMESEFASLLGGAVDDYVHPWKNGKLSGPGGYCPIPIKILEPNNPLTFAFRDAPEAKLITELFSIWLPKASMNDSRAIISNDYEKLPGVSYSMKSGERCKEFAPAIIWIKNCGKGRVYSTALGHDEEIFSVPCVARAMLDGLQYAAGDLKVPDAPATAAGK